MQWLAAILGEIALPLAVAILAWRIALSYQGHIIIRPLHTDAEPWRVHAKRLAVGAVSGIVVALFKYPADQTELAARLVSGDILYILLSFGIYALIPFIMGAVGGWISDEYKVHKIFFVSLTMPIIIAAAAGASGNFSGQKPVEPLFPGKAGWNIEQILPITSAYADDAFAAGLKATTQDSDANDNPFIDGLRLFFGQKEYRVVIHSVLDDREKAEQKAASINKEFGDRLPVPARVGERKPFNRYWPIVLDGWTTYRNAKAIKDSISDLDFKVDDKPYISVRP